MKCNFDDANYIIKLGPHLGPGNLTQESIFLGQTEAVHKVAVSPGPE